MHVCLYNTFLSKEDLQYLNYLPVGSVFGGQTVTITGSGFDSTTSATICGNTCVKDETASNTASQFVCVIPAASGIYHYHICQLWKISMVFLCMKKSSATKKSISGAFKFMKVLFSDKTNLMNHLLEP